MGEKIPTSTGSHGTTAHPTTTIIMQQKVKVWMQVVVSLVLLGVCLLMLAAPNFAFHQNFDEGTKRWGRRMDWRSDRLLAFLSSDSLRSIRPVKILFEGNVRMPSGFNSPSEVYFFTRAPEDYTSARDTYFYEIDKVQDERALDAAKARTRDSALLRMIDFREPTVEVHKNEYSYIVRSASRRDDFKTVMSPESLYAATRARPNMNIPGTVQPSFRSGAIKGLHYSATGGSDDAIGITISAETPEQAKEQFHAWWAKIKEALKALSERFLIVNKETEKIIDEAARKRLDEIQRAKKAL